MSIIPKPFPIPPILYLYTCISNPYSPPPPHPVSYPILPTMLCIIPHHPPPSLPPFPSTPFAPPHSPPPSPTITIFVQNALVHAAHTVSYDLMMRSHAPIIPTYAFQSSPIYRHCRCVMYASSSLMNTLLKTFCNLFAPPYRCPQKVLCSLLSVFQPFLTPSTAFTTHVSCAHLHPQFSPIGLGALCSEKCPEF